MLETSTPHSVYTQCCRHKYTVALFSSCPSRVLATQTWRPCAQVVKNTVNVLAGNTAALAILSWVVSVMTRPCLATEQHAFHVARYDAFVRTEHSATPHSACFLSTLQPCIAGP